MIQQSIQLEVSPYEEFYEWVKKASVNNIVLISEYNMPDEFECIWYKETKTLLDSNKEKVMIRILELRGCLHITENKN